MNFIGGSEFTKSFYIPSLQKQSMAYNLIGKDDQFFSFDRSLVELVSEQSIPILKDKSIKFVFSKRLFAHGLPFIGGANNKFYSKIESIAKEYNANFIQARYIIAGGRNFDSYVSSIVDFYKK